MEAEWSGMAGRKLLQRRYCCVLLIEDHASIKSTDSAKISVTDNGSINVTDSVIISVTDNVNINDADSVIISVRQYQH